VSTGDGTLTHKAFFYPDVGGFSPGTVPFVRAGLAAGEPVLAAVAAPGIDSLQTALGSDADAVSYVEIPRPGRNPTGNMATVLLAFVNRHPRQRVSIIDFGRWCVRSRPG
jgi:hypothetical protein